MSKKQKSYLSTRVLSALLFLWIAHTLGALTMAVAFTQAGMPEMAILGVAVDVALLIVAYAFIYIKIVLPYRRISQVQELFVEQKVFEELFQQDIEISPATQRMTDSFNKLISRQDMINLSQKQAEYLALQNQINPHFLYNTLEAIRGDALEAGQRDIAQTAEALAIYFRYTITEMGDLVTLEEELENIDNYFIIQKYRFGEKIQIRREADEESLYRCRIPKLTLQPIIENAIFHGLEKKIEGGSIAIRMQATEKRLIISIKDDGAGMPQDEVLRINEKLERINISYINEKKRSGGIALRNVAQRVKLLFGEEYGVQLYSTPGIGTEVLITLPKIV